MLDQRSNRLGSLAGELSRQLAWTEGLSVIKIGNQSIFLNLLDLGPFMKKKARVLKPCTSECTRLLKRG